MDLELAIFVTDLQNSFKKKFFCLLLTEGTVHFHNFSKIKSQKAVKKTVGIRFFLLFLIDDRRIRIRIRTSDKRIRIQEAQRTGSATRFVGMFFDPLPSSNIFFMCIGLAPWIQIHIADPHRNQCGTTIYCIQDRSSFYTSYSKEDGCFFFYIQPELLTLSYANDTPTPTS
jgi:hypothetical protein